MFYIVEILNLYLTEFVTHAKHISFRTGNIRTCLHVIIEYLKRL